MDKNISPAPRRANRFSWFLWGAFAVVAVSFVGLFLLTHRQSSNSGSHPQLPETGLVSNFYLKGEPSELSGTGNGAVVTPGVGLQGKVVVRGTGSVSFLPAQTGNGVAFGKGGQQSDNTAYYQFSGAPLGNIFNADQGEISFYIKSSYSFAERLALPTHHYRYVYDVWDGSKRQFSFFIDADSSGLDFAYAVAGSGVNYYLVPPGNADTVFGKGAIAKVRLTWNTAGNSLYINGALVQSNTYKLVPANWTDSSVFLVGAQRYDALNAGFYSCDDVIDELTVSALSNVPTDVAPVISSFTALPSSVAPGQGATLSWAASGAPAPTFSIDQGVGIVMGTSRSISPSVTTTYTLTAANSAGSVSKSITVTVNNPVPVLDTQPPSVPTNLSASPISSSQINLSWSAATDNVGVVGYRIFRNGAQFSVVTKGTVFQDTNLSANTAYVYAVSSYDAAGNVSALSAVASATTLTNTNAALPVISSFIAFPPSVTVGQNIRLFWLVRGTPTLSIDQGIGAVTGNFKSISPSVTTTYTLTAANSAGSVSKSITVTVNNPVPVLDTQPPSVPTNLSASPISSSQINLSWSAATDNVGVVGYRIFRNGAQFSVVTTSTTFQDVGLLANTTYNYAVAAVDAAGNVSPSSTVSTAVTQGGIVQPPVNASNILTIADKSGLAQTNYPVQIGRPFMQGEIANFPQALINGQPLLTQADVKERYGDGSVKHAILSFLLPNLPANGSVAVTFANQSSGNNIQLSASAMLASSFNFDAVMELTSSGVTKTVSARQMLTDGSFTYWTSGPVATTIILADNTPSRKYDIGFDAYRPFRPMFEATFWPAINEVTVRFIGEISNTEELEDVIVSNLALKLGQTNPQTVYTLPTGKSPLTMASASRWTKLYWLGGAPNQQVNINHNLAYLEQTKFFPNYDTSKVISESTINCEYSSCSTAWQKQARDLYDAGGWQTRMGSAGGRPDIGPYPSWTVRWLYTGDWRMKEEAFGLSDLAGAWPANLREGNQSKFLDRASTVPGYGKILSISNRPTLALSAGYNYSYTTAADKIKIVGTKIDGNWTYDTAHEPNAFYPQYILSGDYWYLEEMMFWTSFDATLPNGAATIYAYGRGPTGAEGGLQGDEIRGQAWGLRSRAETAFATPDLMPEKAYFTTLTNDAIAIFDGMRNMTTSSFNGSANWNWGRTIPGKMFTTLGIPPLHQWEAGDHSFAQPEYGIDTTVTGAAISQFEEGFMLYALGRSKELGFPTDNLLNYLGSLYVNMLTNSSYNPYLVANGRVPTVRLSDGQYFSTFADLKTGYNQVWQNVQSFPLDDVEHGYDFISLAASSMIAGLPGGSTAWNFMASHVLSAVNLNTNPKWAIMPRTGN